MPCLIAWVLARRDSKAVISASMSERTVAIACCSFSEGSKIFADLNTSLVIPAIDVPWFKLLNIFELKSKYLNKYSGNT